MTPANQKVLRQTKGPSSRCRMGPLSCLIPTAVILPQSPRGILARSRPGCRLRPPPGRYSGRPVAVKLTSNIYGFGHEFCHALRALMEHGCVPVTRLFPDGNGMIFIYHPSTRRAELWSGSWKEDDPGVYSVLPSSSKSRRGRASDV